MQKQTTGAVISRLGVATVLMACAPDEKVRAIATETVEEILNGDGGVPQGKVIRRSMERCAIGGASIRLGPDHVPVWGTN